MDRDSKRMSMEPGAFVPGRHVRQPMGRFELEDAEDLHAAILHQFDDSSPTRTTTREVHYHRARVHAGEIMSRARWYLASIALAWGAEASQSTPFTVAERLEACAAYEDDDPARAVGLADSVLEETTAISVLERARALGCRGWAYTVLNRRDRARHDAEQLREVLQAMPHSPERAELLRRVGTVYHRVDDRINSVEIYLQALAEAEALGMDAARIPLYVNLGVLHAETFEYDRARVSYEQALALMERTGDMRYEAPVRYNLGVMLSTTEHWAEARAHFERTLELITASGMGGPQQRWRTELGLSNTLLQLGEVERAEAILARIRADPKALADASIRAQLDLIDIGRLIEGGNHGEALRRWQAMPFEVFDERQQAGAWSDRSRILVGLGRYREALEAEQAAHRIRIQIMREQNFERLANLEARLRDREQRLELEAAQRTNQLQAQALDHTRRLQRLGIGVGLLGALIALGIILWQRSVNRRLDRIGRTDALTGLPNRREMVERIQRCLDSGANGTGALLLVDIDHFKRINDRHGHEIGDAVLRATAERLHRVTGSFGASVGRWGGEEFLVLQPESDERRCSALAQALVENDAVRVPAEGGEETVSVSVGFAPLPLVGLSDRRTWQHSLRLADAALYDAKRRGRKGWVGYWTARADPSWTAPRISADPIAAAAAGVLRATASRTASELLHVVR